MWSLIVDKHDARSLGLLVVVRFAESAATATATSVRRNTVHVQIRSLNCHGSYVRVQSDY